MMGTIIREQRTRSGLTLRDISKALGKGFSQARVSLAERGLISLPAHDEKAILDVIERLAPMQRHRLRIVAIARDIDFAPFVADVREDRHAAVHA